MLSESILADLAFLISGFVSGLITGVYYIKKKMESKAEDMLDGLYGD